MEPPSPQSLELLLTKLARLRLKVREGNLAMQEAYSMTAAEHRLTQWQLAADREKLAELETLVWLAYHPALQTSNPSPVPNPAPTNPNPDAKQF